MRLVLHLHTQLVKQCHETASNATHFKPTKATVDAENAGLLALTCACLCDRVAVNMPVFSSISHSALVNMAPREDAPQTTIRPVQAGNQSEGNQRCCLLPLPPLLEPPAPPPALGSDCEGRGDSFRRSFGNTPYPPPWTHNSGAQHWVGRVKI